jgi:hypothetical protein
MPVSMGAERSARAHEELFAYWASRRQAGRLPCRAAIHPAHFKRLLPTISLIDVKAAAPRYRLRLAGTGLYPIYGREITGHTLEEIYNSAAAEYWRGELDKVVRDRRPSVGVHNFSWRGAAHVSMLWIRLPLASNGADVDMILGYDSITGSAGGSASSGIRAA